MWTPRQFVLAGRYCDLDSLRSQLERVRDHANAKAAVLFAFQDELRVRPRNPHGRPLSSPRSKFFQSLLVLAHEERATERALHAELVARLQGSGVDIPATDSRGTLESVLTEGSALMTSLQLYFPPHTPCALSWSVATDAREPSMRFAILVVGNSSFKASTCRSILSAMKTMLYASAPLVVHRNLELIKRTEEVITECELRFATSALTGQPDTPPSDMIKAFAAAALNAALKLTSSSVGNFYIASPGQAQLVLAAEVHNEQPIEAISIEDEQSVVAYVYSRRRPLLINDVAAFKTMHPEIGYRWVGSADLPHAYAELAVPIMQPSLDPTDTRVLGVINVEKATEAQGPFTADDLAVLRSIALRFCLRRAQIMRDSANKALADLPTAHFGSLGSQPARHLADVVDPTVPLSELDPRTPVELWLVREQIATTLRRACSLTRTKTATLRVLSPDGAFLVRFCGYPAGTLTDPHAVIQVKQRNSVNAWVARNGSECYIPDLTAPKPFRAFPGLLMHLAARDNIRCEYCVPIFLRGRVIGTLNLESEHRNAYATDKTFIAAIVEQIRLTILLAQNLAQQEVLSMNALSILNSHELLKCCDRLEAICSSAEQIVPTVAGELIALQRKIRACVDQSAPVQTTLTEATLGEVIRTVTADRDLSAFVKWRPGTTDPEAIRLSGSVLRAVRLALSEVLENSFTAAANIPRSVVTLSLRTQERGGRTYLALKVVHPFRVSTPLAVTRRIFRVPIARGGRPHIGAFLAGTLMRGVGGEVWFAADEATQQAVTVMEIPYGAPQ